MAKDYIYCGKCGERLDAGAKFCGKCGAKVPDASRNIVKPEEFGGKEPEWTDTPGEEAEAAAEEKKPRNFKSLLRWIILAAVIVVVIIILVVIFVSPGSIKLDRYISFESSGMDGYGSVTCSFDKEAFYADYSGKVEMTGSASGGEAALDALYADYIDWNLDYVDAADGSLSNGDTVVLQWDCRDSEEKKNFNKRLKHSDITYEVSDLTPVEEIDVFDDVTVMLSGAEPAGNASIETDEENYGLTPEEFSLSASDGLSNGDIVTVTFSEAEAANLAENYGVSPMYLEKDYEISGLPVYITQIDDIPEDTFDELRDIAEGAIQDESGAELADGIAIEGLEYDGCYLVYEDPSEEDSYFSTELYLVYTVNVAQSEAFDAFSYYTYVKFYNLLLMPDGTCSFDPDNYNMCHNSFSLKTGQSADQTETFYGFVSTTDLMNAIIDESYMLYDTNMTATEDSSVPADAVTAVESPAADTTPGDKVEVVQNDSAGSGDYICSYSSDRLITPTDLNDLKQGDYGTMPGGRSLEQMVVNEIYAKHGYQFTDQEVQKYFEQKAWYNAIGTHSNDMDVIKGRMNSIEQQNVDYLSTFL